MIFTLRIVSLSTSFSVSWLSQFIPGRKHPKSPNWTEMPFLRLRFNVSIKASSTNFYRSTGNHSYFSDFLAQISEIHLLVITFCATYFSALVLSKPNVLFLMTYLSAIIFLFFKLVTLFINSLCDHDAKILWALSGGGALTVLDVRTLIHFYLFCLYDSDL